MLASGGYAALLVWRKVPLLLQAPRQLIEESFVTRPSRLKHALEGVVAFIREERYRDAFYAVTLALLGWLRLRLLRSERLVFHLASMLDARRHAVSGGERRYWDELKRAPSDAAASADAPTAREVGETPIAVVATTTAPVAADSVSAPAEQPKPAMVPAMDSVVPRDGARTRPRSHAADHRVPARKRTKADASSLPG